MTTSMSLGHFQTHIMCQQTTEKWIKQSLKKSPQNPTKTTGKKNPKPTKPKTLVLNMRTLFTISFSLGKWNFKSKCCQVLLEDEKHITSLILILYKTTQESLKLTWKRNVSIFFLVFLPDEKNALLYLMLVLVKKRGLTIIDEQATADVQFQSFILILFFHLTWKPR